jgi:hypothetical protein
MAISVKLAAVEAPAKRAVLVAPPEVPHGPDAAETRTVTASGYHILTAVAVEATLQTAKARGVKETAVVQNQTGVGERGGMFTAAQSYQSVEVAVLVASMGDMSIVRQSCEESAMSWLCAVEEYDLAMPTRLRRLTLLAVVGLLGLLVPHTFPATAGQSTQLSIVMALALLAGASALWSP